MLDPEITSTVTAAMPFLITTVKQLGEKIWFKTSDDLTNSAADSAVGLGHRLINMMFGSKKNTDESNGGISNADPLGGTTNEPSDTTTASSRNQIAATEALKDVVNDPTDEDAQAALRLAVRKLFIADPQLCSQVKETIDKCAPKELGNKVSQKARDHVIQVGGNVAGNVTLNDK